MSLFFPELLSSTEDSIYNLSMTDAVTAKSQPRHSGISLLCGQVTERFIPAVISAAAEIAVKDQWSLFDSQEFVPVGKSASALLALTEIGLGSSFLRLFSDPPFPSSAEIASVFPAAGSLAGGTDLTITGDFFEEPVQVTAAGNRRNDLRVFVNVQSPFDPTGLHVQW